MTSNVDKMIKILDVVFNNLEYKTDKYIDDEYIMYECKELSLCACVSLQDEEVMLSSHNREIYRQQIRFLFGSEGSFISNVMIGYDIQVSHIKGLQGFRNFTYLTVLACMFLNITCGTTMSGANDEFPIIKHVWEI